MSDSRPPGVRLAQLLASELVARDDGPLARLELVDVADAETLAPDEFGERAYGVVAHPTATGESEAPVRLADVYAHDDRARVEFRSGLDAFPEAAHDAALRVRPKAVEPPRVLVFVEDGAEVKRVLGPVRAAIEAIDAGERVENHDASDASS